jgi:hypothetical protein
VAWNLSRNYVDAVASKPPWNQLCIIALFALKKEKFDHAARWCIVITTIQKMGAARTVKTLPKWIKSRVLF